MLKQSQMAIIRSGASMLDATTVKALVCCWSFKVDKWMIPERSLPVWMFFVSPPALSPNLKPQLLWVCVGIMKRAKCLEQGLLAGAGGRCHPEPSERERMCPPFGGKGNGRTTCWPDFWSSNVSALTRNTYVSYCQLQAKIDRTSLNPNKPMLTSVNHFSESCIKAEEFA